MFNKTKKEKLNQGFGLIEVIVGVAIISVAFLGLMSVANLSFKILEKSSNNIKAGFLLEEGVEAVKIIRDSGWSNISSLSNGVNYYLNYNGTTWATTTTPVYMDNLFERTFVLNDVSRDINDDIADSGTVDPDTKKITISVSWKDGGGTITQSFSTYITNLFE